MKKNILGQGHAVLAAGIFFAILVLLYQIAGRQNQRVDFTREKIHSLSPEGLEVVKRLTGERLRLRAFFADGDPARKDFELLLKAIRSHHRRFLGCAVINGYYIVYVVNTTG